MPSSNQLAALAVTERNQLESLLMQFDRAWAPMLLRDYCGPLESESSELFRQVALGELVKIDLQRRWSSGQGKLLEEYVAQIPALGTVESVDADLILVEYAARRAVDASLDLQSYAGRFPNQFEQLTRLASASIDSNLTPGSSAGQPLQKPAQASIETSRAGVARDTNVNKSETSKKKGQPTDLPVEFGRYRILRELGSGAMGTVYLAHDTQLDRQVAIKTPTFKGDKDQELVTRFYREARAAAKIHHRNICPVYDVGEIDGRHFISMAFVKGRSMSEFITADKLPPPKTSAILVHRLATALAEAHRHKVIHRDLKPANVMIDMKREPVVMDFGLARQTDTESRMTQSGMIVGTPAYMSPEQLSGNPSDVGPAADIYSLGVILYELLTGKLPFRGAIAQVVYKIMHEEPPAPSEIRGGIGPDLEAICAKMMAKDRGERFQSMDQVAAALKNYLTGKTQKRAGASAAPAASPQDSDTQRRDGTAETSSSGVSETGALNAFFAAEAAADPMPTGMESISAEQSEPRAPKPLPKASRDRFGGKTKWIAAGLAGACILVLGVIFLVRTPYGTIRVETLGDLEGLEVLVDGDSIRLTGTETTPAREHELALKLGGAQLKLDPKTNEFVVTQNGAERRLKVTIGDLQLSSKTFTVTKNNETVLKIEVLPNKAKVARSVASKPRAEIRQGVKQPADGFVSLFNGTSLEGWTVHGTSDWTVESGEIVCAGKDSKLVHELGPLADFDIRLECLLAPGANSGLFLRSGMNGDQEDGYEVQLATSNTYGTGSIWGRAPFDEKVVEPSTWFPVEVRVRGNRITVTVNGRETVDYTDPEKTFSKGHIALQGHGALPGSRGAGRGSKRSKRVRFRNIEIKQTVRDEASAATATSSTGPAGAPIAMPNKQPIDVDAQTAAAIELAARGQWHEAARVVERILKQSPAAFDTRRGGMLAMFYAATGNRAAHARHCRLLFAKYSNPKYPFEAEQPAKAYLIFPGADDPELLAKAVAGAKYAVQTGRNQKFSAWYFLAQGMAEYRTGNHAAALRSLETPAKNKDRLVRIPSLAFAAMASFRLGNVADAQRLLAQAQAEYEQSKPPGNIGGQILIKEAKALINGESPAEKPASRPADGAGSSASSSSPPRTTSAPRKSTITLVRTLGPHASAVRGVAFSLNGKQVICAAGPLRIWNLDDGSVLKQFGKGCFRVDVSLDGRFVLAAGHRGRLEFWNLGDLSRPTSRTLKGLKRSVWDVQFIGDGRRALVTSGEGILHLWDLETGESARKFWASGGTGFAGAISVSSDGKRIAVGYRNTAKIWDMETAEQRNEFPRHSSFVQDLEFLPGDEEIVIATAIAGRPDRTPNLVRSLVVWNVATGADVRQFRGHKAGVTSVRVHPDKQRIVSTGHDGTMRIWNIQTAEQLNQVDVLDSSGQPVMLMCLDITSDGRFAVTGGSDGNARLWQLNTTVETTSKPGSP